MKKTKKKQGGSNISIIIAITSALVCSIAMGISGSPYEMIHRLDASNIIPPIWLWRLTNTIWFFLLGLCSGIIIREISCGSVSGEKEIYAYKGGLFFISLIFLSLIHYPLFFSAERIFISLIVAIIAIICSLLCAALWSKVSAFACITVSAYSFWLFYVIFINAGLFLRN